MSTSARYLAGVELLVGVRQAAELPGAPVQVDVARTEGREEAHLGLRRAHWCPQAQEIQSLFPLIVKRVE